MLTDLIYYDLKVATLIAVFYLFYQLLLARETTHTLNRAVLLSGIALMHYHFASLGGCGKRNTACFRWSCCRRCYGSASHRSDGTKH